MDEGKGKASGDLLLTRLTKKRLSELGLRLSGDSGLYIEGELLDQLARSDPDGYLRRIAKIKKAVLSAADRIHPKGEAKALLPKPMQGLGAASA